MFNRADIPTVLLNIVIVIVKLNSVTARKFVQITGVSVTPVFVQCVFPGYFFVEIVDRVMYNIEAIEYICKLRTEHKAFGIAAAVQIVQIIVSIKTRLFQYLGDLLVEIRNSVV